MTDHATSDDIRKDISDLRLEMRTMASAINDIKISQARSDERQTETTKKLDMMTLALSNNYVGAIEFGTIKQRVEKLESWNVWIVRVSLGAIVLAGIAALRIKGGI